MLQNNNIQNIIAASVKTRLEPFLGTKIEIGHVSVDILNRIIIKDLTGYDDFNDTLVYSPKTVFDFGGISFSKRRVLINKIELHGAKIHFFIDSTRHLNLEYIIDRILARRDTATEPWHVTFANIGIFNSRLRIEDYEKTPYSRGVNFSDMVLNNLEIRAKNLTAFESLATFQVNMLSFVEASGFNCNKLTANMQIKRSMLHFSNLKIHTPNSYINAPKAHFDFEYFRDFKEFASKVSLNIVLGNSKTSFLDLRYFAPVLWGMEQKFDLMGIAEGMLSDIQCKQIQFSTGENTSFSGNISAQGLPDINNTHATINAKKLSICPSDVEAFSLPEASATAIILPKWVQNFGYTEYTGMFKGSVKRFISYGSFSTEIGSIKTDLSMEPGSKGNLAFVGKISALGIDAGKILDMSDMGKADLYLNADATISQNNNISGSFSAQLDQLFFKGYNYSNINVSGTLKENSFDGTVNVNDENLKLSSAGYFGFGKSNTSFNFSATLTQANPFALKLINDSVNFVSGQMVANFKGRHIESINGEIGLANLLFKKNTQNLFVRHIYIRSNNSTDLKTIDVDTDIFSAHLEGVHELQLITNSAIRFVKLYLPGTAENNENKQLFDPNHFSFRTTLKNTKPILDFFAPGTEIAPNTIISGNYNPSDSIMKFNISAGYFKYGNVIFDQLSAAGHSNSDSLWIETESKRLLIGPQICLNGIKTSINVIADTARIHLLWKDSAAHESELNLLAYYGYSGSVKPILNIEIKPTSFFILNEHWEINAAKVVKDSLGIIVHKLSIHNNEQNVVVKGRISQNPTDALVANFSNFNLNIINFLINTNHITLDGKLNGQLKVKNILNSGQIESDIEIDNLKVNKELLGKASIEILLNSEIQELWISAKSETPDGRKIILKGDLGTENKILDFELNVLNAKLQAFQPFVAELFNIKKGRLSGNLKIKGQLSKPLVNGEIMVDSALFSLKALNAPYLFSAPVKIADNKIFLRNINLYDPDKHVLKLDGIIDNNYFSDFQFFINLSLDKNMVINLAYNNDFPLYGKAYASGIVRITGNPKKVNIDVIGAKTEKNTVLYVSLKNKLQIQKNEFITFLNPTVTNKNAIDLPLFDKISPTLETKTSALLLDIDLEVTPDAEMQLIFDPSMGDLIRAQGAGNLKIGLDQQGNFTVRGNYIIESGDYIFTLQNLTNKRFILDQRGSIAFNGNPMDAILDMKAIYKTRASLYNLFLSDEDLKKRIPVECHLFVTGKLQNPDISYDIALPNATEETRNKLKEAINNEQELSKQFLSLLVLNNFMPNVERQQVTQASIIGRDMATTTSMELLSSQVSNWMSQINSDFDIGLSYRPGDRTFTNQEVEVALSTQLLDDRVTISSNIDFANNQTGKTEANPNANSVVGDVIVEFKLTDNVVLKAFNRTNDQLFYDNDIYTRGVGIAYREEFRNFADLRRRYYNMLFGKKSSAQTDTLTNGN